MKRAKKRKPPTANDKAIDYANRQMPTDVDTSGFDDVDGARYYGLLDGYLAGYRAAQRAARKTKNTRSKK